MTTYSLRLATDADTAAIVEFNTAMALETENLTLQPATITAGVSNLIADQGRGFYLVVESNGQIVASLMVTTEWSDWRNGTFWWIQSVYVAPDHRRKGLYSQLYKEVKNRARADTSVCGFRLYVEQDNDTAQKTYEALGMQQTHYLMFEEMVS